MNSALIVIIFTWWFHHLARFFFKTLDLKYLCHFFSVLVCEWIQVWRKWIMCQYAWAQIMQRVLLRKAFGCLHMYTHAWHMSACLGCSLLFSLAFSHPPPPPIITRLYPLFLFCFLSLFLSLPPFLFCSTSAHLLHLLSRSSLLQYGAVLSGHAASIAEKESGIQ